MITSTSSSRSDLNSIQALMPLTVRVKGAKRIHERLSATWEDAVRRASRQEVALLLSMKKKKTFQRQIKQFVRINLTIWHLLNGAC